MCHIKTMKNEATMTAYAAWLEADKAKTAFWTANTGNWTPEVNAVYTEMLNKSEDLFCVYCAEATGKSVAQVAYDINEKIHSARD